jgi:hypothetical protein
MTTPRRVTETVPDSIAAREPVTIAHIVQGDRLLASIVAVPDGRRSRETTHTPALVIPTA